MSRAGFKSWRRRSRISWRSMTCLVWRLASATNPRCCGVPASAIPRPAVVNRSRRRRYSRSVTFEDVHRGHGLCGRSSRAWSSWMSRSPPTCPSSPSNGFEAHPERRITLRHLLSHTAGFTHEAPNGNSFAIGKGTFESHCRSISDTWLRFPVGHHFEYSNLGVDLAGYILQRVSGLPFHAYLRRELFAPLGLTRTTFRDSHDRPRHRAGDRPQGYRQAGTAADADGPGRGAVHECWGRVPVRAVPPPWRRGPAGFDAAAGNVPGSVPCRGR